MYSCDWGWLGDKWTNLSFDTKQPAFYSITNWRSFRSQWNNLELVWTRDLWAGKTARIFTSETSVGKCFLLWWQSCLQHANKIISLRALISKPEYVTNMHKRAITLSGTVFCDQCAVCVCHVCWQDNKHFKWIMAFLRVLPLGSTAFAFSSAFLNLCSNFLFFLLFKSLKRCTKAP